MNLKKQIALYSLLAILLLSNCYFIINSRNSSQNYWKGKKILWIGTSIPETGYPQMVGKNIHANVINIAFGSSMVRRGLKITDTLNDPLGIKNVYYKSAYRSLIQSPKDKEWIINNWSKFKTLVGNSDQLPELNDQLKSEIRSSSFVNRLKDNLDADLFVIDHGFNDRYGSYESDSIWHSIPKNSRDLQTFIGAVNYLIDYIRSNNPKARIVFIGHYTRDSIIKGKNDIWEAQNTLAEYWNAPICKLWERTGFSNQKVITHLFWENPNNSKASLKSHPDSIKELSQVELYMSDGIHPRSKETQELIANIITPWMQDVR